MRKDPLTNEQFEQKRTSQRFATPMNRIKYHNLNAKKLRHYEAGIDKPLKRNHKICLELLPPNGDKKEIVLHKQYLLGKGYSFGVITNYANYGGKNYPAIYRYLIIPLENEQIKLIKND